MGIKFQLDNYEIADYITSFTKTPTSIYERRFKFVCSSHRNFFSLFFGAITFVSHRVWYDFSMF
jgi:hypothetical protein